MSLRGLLRGGSTDRALIIPAAILLFPVVYGLVGRGDAADDGPFVERPGPQHERCVRETEYMRYHHWELLQEVRDAVVRDGVRGEITLAGCRECHPDRASFCNRCHQAVSLQPDCFGCHHYPETAAAGEVPDAGPAGLAEGVD
jgi:hypothetical protein